MKVAVTVYSTIQTSHDTGKYVPIETRVFDGAATLDGIMQWARRDGRFADWHNLVFTPAPSENSNATE